MRLERLNLDRPVIKFSLRRSQIQSVQPSSCFPLFRARSKHFASLRLGDDEEEVSLKMPSWPTTAT